MGIPEIIKQSGAGGGKHGSMSFEYPMKQVLGVGNCHSKYSLIWLITSN